MDKLYRIYKINMRSMMKLEDYEPNNLEEWKKLMDIKKIDADIANLNATTARLNAETARINDVDIANLNATTARLNAETAKIMKETRFYPWVIVVSASVATLIIGLFALLQYLFK